MSDLTPPNNSIVSCKNLVKIYKIADLEVIALQGLDLEVVPGEVLALVGPSGAGKSTLLNIIGGLDTPSAGEVKVSGHNLLSMKSGERTIYKREKVGFVWQQPSRNLVPYLSAVENVELPMMLKNSPTHLRRSRAMELLELVDLTDRANFRPNQLSGGQQQRVALAVALANHPPIVLGDELTGQIDSAAALQVFNSLKRINKELNTTIILVTHDPQVSGLVNRVVAIRDGRTSTEIRRKHQHDSVQEEEWVILDRAGRLQIPGAFVEELNLKERVKVRMEENHISVWPGSKATVNLSESVKAVKPMFLKDHNAETTGARIETCDLNRSFSTSSGDIHAVKDITIVIPAGQLAVIKGRSGSGKTTLLNLIAGLDDPTSGEIMFDSKPLSGMSNQEIVQLRRRKLGFVYQSFGLLPFLSAGENVEIPLRLLRTRRKERRQKVDMMLRLVGLQDRKNHRTHELSGGEQQRVAIARALVNQPALILADEPTGQLDSQTGAAIIELFKQITEQLGITVIIASHDPNVREAANLVFDLRDGLIS